jgi:hypothetical protein
MGLGNVQHQQYHHPDVFWGKCEPSKINAYIKAEQAVIPLRYYINGDILKIIFQP